MNKQMLIWGSLAVLAALAAYGFYRYNNRNLTPPTKNTTDAPATATGENKVLKLGDMGAEVAALQRSLGFDLMNQTGTFDKATEDAIFKLLNKKTATLREVNAKYLETITSENG